MKGKPWSVEEEKQLRGMVQEHKRLSEIAGFFGKSSASVKMKISRSQAGSCCAANSAHNYF